MIYSVDSLAAVRDISRMPPPKELWERGFFPKPGNLPDSITWYHNPPKGSPLPGLSYYQTWQGWRLRADFSLPKLVNSQNITLLTTEEIHEGLRDASRNITEGSGSKFDALNALGARIDYATNHGVLNKHVGRFFERYKRFKIPWLPFRPEISHPTTLYHGGNSRMIRIYEKLLQEFGPENTLNSIEGLIRIEYQFPNESAVQRLSKRLGLGPPTVQEMVSENSRTLALNELFGLLKLDTFEPEANFSLKYFYDRTGSIAIARKLSSFVNTFELLGKDFYRLAKSGISKATYLRQLRDCQRLGW